ncbi:serine hydrolase domain-containing protein [Streptomyces sp. NPDC048290]|uniref:serine hydrolase domain-containing protein n=1 Tax=Streptomyces sp. NPDC048290 TaxID=3155811 RepID=UPI00341BC32C
MPTRTRTRLATLTATAALLTAGTAGTTATAAPKTPTPTPIQSHLDTLVSQGATSALIQIRDNNRVALRDTSGTARLPGPAPVSPTGTFRTGSVTKSFTATVLLQLVGEGRLTLDDRLSTHLPDTGLPHADAITVRQLLNHTSGIFDYTQDPDVVDDFTDPAILARWLRTDRWRDWRPEDLVAQAADPANPPSFPPGTKWRYSNTNYILAGLLIEELTGHTYAEEITHRIIRPLSLTGTSVPGSKTHMPKTPHAHSYVIPPGHHPTDITSQNVTVSGAAGSLITTAQDLNRFYAALAEGRLLRPAQQRALTTFIDLGPKGGYALGLERAQLSCTTVFGHGGGIFGYATLAFTTPDATRQVTLSYTPTTLFPTIDQDRTAYETLEAAFCPPDPTP